MFTTPGVAKKQLEVAIAGIRVAVSAGHEFSTSASDNDLVAMMTLAGDALRHIEALLVTTTNEIARRSTSGDTAERLTTRLGCASVSEVAQRATRVSSQTARKWIRVGDAIADSTALSSGESLPAPLPHLRQSLLEGAVGIDGAHVIASALLPKNRGMDPELVALADEALADVSRGTPHTGPAQCADVLRIHAEQWIAAIDPDGSEPVEAAALRHRALTLGPVKEGLVELRGRLLPEVADQLTRICDAVATPRHTGVTFRPSDEVDDADPRTATQKRHDALATALFTAAASADLPTTGGSAPTLVVVVDQESLEQGHGSALLPRLESHVPLAAAHHAGCAGTTQRVLMNGGKIVALETTDRIFNHHQRRAIATRDGGCVIPGCTTPASWCEVHHVTEWANGGKTHTDNGVLLCWFHHRYLEQSGWHVRIIAGTVEVKAPNWIDPSGKFRPPQRPPKLGPPSAIRRC